MSRHTAIHCTIVVLIMMQVVYTGDVCGLELWTHDRAWSMWHVCNSGTVAFGTWKTPYTRTCTIPTERCDAQYVDAHTWRIMYNNVTWWLKHHDSKLGWAHRVRLWLTRHIGGYANLLADNGYLVVKDRASATRLYVVWDTWTQFIIVSLTFIDDNNTYACRAL